MHGVFESLAVDFIHHQFEEGGGRTVNSELGVGYGTPYYLQGLNRQIQTVPFHDRSVIHDHKRPDRRVAIGFLEGTETKDFFIWRVHNHLDLPRLAPARTDD